jgi:phosphoribosylamine--glycine ligase
MDFDFYEMCEAIVNGTLKEFKFNWKKGYCVAPVVVSGGYPKAYKKGLPIKFNDEKIKENGSKIFIAGGITNRRSTEGSEEIVTSGGRVLACSAQGNTFQEAWDKAYQALEYIKFDDMFYRKDIGLPGAAESN